MRSRKIKSFYLPTSTDLTFCELLGRLSFISTYIIYVLSNSKLLIDIVPVDAKHGAFILIAIIALLLKPKQCLLSFLIASPIILIYLLSGIPTYAYMVMVFAAALPLISDGITSIIKRRGFVVISMVLIISLVPMLISMGDIRLNSIFDTTYGRPRMLLGYFHPKEAAISFAIPLFLLFLTLNSPFLFFWFLGSFFLWLVGSRNIAIMFFLAWLFRWQGRIIKFFLLPFLIFVIFWLILDNSVIDTIDELTSLRMSSWINALSFSSNLGILDLQSGDRFGVDSFFVEVVVAGGLWMIPIIFIWLVLIVILLIKTSLHSPWTFVSFIMLLFIASFDTGIASTGNMMHVFLWSLMLSEIFDSQLSFSKFLRSSYVKNKVTTTSY